MRVDFEDDVDVGEGDDGGDGVESGEDGVSFSGTASMLSRKKGLLAHSMARCTTNSRWSGPTRTRRRGLHC